MIKKDLLDTIQISIPNRSFVYLESVGSTNQFAKNELKSDSEKALILAYEQSAGRGQRNRKWQSEKGANLTFSLVDPYPTNFKYHEYLLKVGLTLAHFLRNRFQLNALLKWPNDILVNYSKISGILVEAVYRGSKPTKLITGIGLNVNQSLFNVDDYQATSMHKATSMHNETGQYYELHHLLIDFVNYFDQVMNVMLPTKQLYDQVNDILAFKDQWVALQLEDASTLVLKLVGLNDNGEICFEDRQNKMRRFLHESIRIKPSTRAF